MSPNLILGLLLRYAGARDATVCVEIDAALLYAYNEKSGRLDYLREKCPSILDR